MVARDSRVDSVARYHQAHIASGMQACRLPSLTARSNSPVLSDSTKQQIVGVLVAPVFSIIIFFLVCFQ